MSNEKKFVEAWKKADIELKRLKRERLRSMPESHGAVQMGATSAGANNTGSSEAFHSHGLARWQGWMMRLRVIELQKRHGLDA